MAFSLLTGVPAPASEKWLLGHRARRGRWCVGVAPWRAAAFIMLLIGAVAAGVVHASPLVSFDGWSFNEGIVPLRMTQDSSDINRAIVVDRGADADSGLTQRGADNRAAVIQFGNDKRAVVEQSGDYNRVIVFQIPSAETDRQSLDVEQRGGTSFNYSFTVQAPVMEATALEQHVKALTPATAVSVAQNFVHGSDTLWTNLILTENMAHHFASIMQRRMEEGRLPAHLCMDAQGSDQINACNEHPWFLVLGYQSTSQDSVPGISGYDQSLYSTSLGAQFPVGSYGRLGLALQYAESDGGLDLGGDVDTTAFQIATFGSLVRGRQYVDFLAGTGYYDHVTRRSYGELGVRGDFGGRSFIGRTETGYYFDHGNYRFGPLFAVTYGKTWVDGYQEQGHPLMVQQSNGQSRSKILLTLGGGLNRVDHAGRFRVHSSLRMELEHDVGHRHSETVRSTYLFNPGSSVYTFIDGAKRETYGRLAGGVNVVSGSRSRLSLSGSKRVGSGLMDQHQVSGHWTFKF